MNKDLILFKNFTLNWDRIKKCSEIKDAQNPNKRRIKSQLLSLHCLLVLTLTITGFTSRSTIIAQDKPAKPAKTPSVEKPIEENPNATETKPDNEERFYPELEEMLKQIPSAKDLVQKPPVDWIVLESKRVMPVMLVYPRPDTVEKMDAALKEFEKSDFPRGTLQEQTEFQEKKKEMLFLEFSIYEDAGLKTPRLFRINYNKINSIVYYEDLMLKRINILRNEFRIRDAFELLHQLRRRSPDWKGIEQAHNQILFSASQMHMKEKQFEDAIVKLEELHKRDANFPGISQSMGIAIDQLIVNAVNKEDFRQGRFFLRRLEKFYPQHDVLKKWSRQLKKLCTQIVQSAEKSYQEKKYKESTELINKAAKVWPRLPGLTKIHNRICLRYQTLRVGVVDQPGAPRLPIKPDANTRYLELTESHLFELDHIEDTPHYRTKYFEKWTPTDLGRQTIFDLRPGRSYWESQPKIFSSDLLSTLKNKMDPHHPSYDQRLDYFIDSISVTSPYQFEIGFSHVPLKPELLFRFPFPAISQKNPKGKYPNHLKPVRFEIENKTEHFTQYIRTRKEPDGLNLAEYHVAEVMETKYPDYEHAAQALIREQVDYLPKVPPAMAKELAGDERFFVLPYSVPDVHVIQFNPRSKAIRNRQIRRAMAYSLDVRKLLQESFLNSVPYLNANVTTAPFAHNSYAFNTTMTPRAYDLSAAIPLVLITKKKLGGKLPELKMIANPEPETMRVVKEIIKKWNQIGIPVRLIENKEGTEDWDIAYRCLKMEEPITDMWTFIADDPQHKIESLIHLPDWLRLELIQLERISNWNDAIRTLQDLHRHLYEEVEYIPLWEIYNKMVITKKASGFSETPVSTYYNIERWVVTPWFSKQYQ